MNFPRFAVFIAYALGESLLNILWQGILLVAAIIFVLSIFRALNAATRYLILCLVLVTLVLLPFIGISSFVENLNYILSDGVANQFGISGDEFGSNLNLTPIAKTFRQTFSISVPSRIPSILLLIFWVPVIFFMLFRLLRSFIHIRKLKHNLLVFPSEYYHIFEGLLRLVNIKRKVSIYASCKTKMPIAIGLINPIILIPHEVLDKLTEEQLSHVILHELAHVKRWDDWTNLMQKIIEAFYFWHPALFWVKKQLNLYREIACDDYVITLLNKPKFYALCLTRLIELDIATSRQTMATGVAWHKKHISKRLKKIIENNRDRSSRLSILAISLAIYVICLAFSLFINVMPSVALNEPSYESSQTYIQSEVTKVSAPTDSQEYMEIAKLKGKDEKQILSNEAEKQKATISLPTTVRKYQANSHNMRDIELPKTQSPLLNKIKEPNKIDEPAKASVDAIVLEPSLPSRHELELSDYKQTKNSKKADKASSSLKQALIEKKEQAINGTGDFISEVGRTTGESFSELGKILNSEAKGIKRDTKSNFSNMKSAYKKTTQAVTKKLDGIRIK